MQAPLDFYTFKARLLPALLVALPLVITGIGLFPKYLAGWKSLYAVATSCGLVYLLAELGRRAGALKQEKLFKAWGGKPSVDLLRHRKAANKALVAERHRKLALLFPHLALPSSEDERRNPKKADEIYEVVGKALIDRTRDKQVFPLLFQENCSYGFWRNLWGLKPAGITVSVLTLASIAAVGLLRPAYLAFLDKGALIVTVIVDVAFLCAWIFWVTPKAIRVPAEAYAERLLEASDELLRQEELKRTAK